MSRYRERVADQGAHIASLRVALVLMTALAGFMGAGWYQATRMPPPLYIPPDLSAGATVRPGEIPESSVHAFAFYVWQQLNRWPRNGESDYAENLFRFSPYLSRACQMELQKDLDKRARAGELRERVRGVQPVAGSHFRGDRVRRRTEDLWLVVLDLELEEFYMGTRVKHRYIRYPLRVLRYDVDRKRNPFGLILDCFDEDDPPQEIEPGERVSQGGPRSGA